MAKKWIEYECGGRRYKGYLAYNEKNTSAAPIVIVAHAWKGLDDFACKKADFLSELGYVGFAADLYGDGISVETKEEAEALMIPLFLDRKELRSRIVSAYQTASSFEFGDPSNMGAIGFCFGGLTVIELFRSGVPLKGVVSFHGVLGDTLGNHKANRVPSADQMQGSILILHGYKDPLVSKEDIDHIQNEFEKAKIDWQMHIYGEARHAFTNPLAKEPESGLMYHQKTEHRSILTMQNFFNEVFQ